MKRVRLYGALRAQFGKEYRLDVASAAEAIHALCRIANGFQAYLLKHSKPGYQVIVGGQARDKDQLIDPVGEELIQLVPIVAGAKSDGVTMILGAVLVAAGAYFGQPWMMQMGGAMIAGGAAEMLTSPPSLAAQPGDKGPDDTPTYAFSGPHLTTGQGNPVPVGYGRLRIGGAIISMGISPETWPDKGFGGKAADNNGNPGGTGDLTPWVWAVGPA